MELDLPIYPQEAIVSREVLFLRYQSGSVVGVQNWCKYRVHTLYYKNSIVLTQSLILAGLRLLITHSAGHLRM